MIEATIKYSGTFIDRPNVIKILIAEDTVAAEKPLVNGKTERLTAGDLYRVFWLKHGYVQSIDTDLNVDPEINPDNDILPHHFELWFKKRYLEGKNYCERIISIDYNIINEQT